MLHFMLIALTMITLPDPGQIETLNAGQDVTLDLSDGQGWFRILEDDYVCLRVDAPGAAGLEAYDEYGDILCSSHFESGDGGTSLYLSAFKDYWFYVRVMAEDSGPERIRAAVEEIHPEMLEYGSSESGVIGRNMMARTYTFIPERAGSWTIRLEGSGDTDLDLEVYGPTMRLWGSSLSLSGSETVTVSALPAESLTVVVSRYGKTGIGDYSLSAQASGGFEILKPSGRESSIAPGEIHRLMIPGHDDLFFLDLSILSPGADIDIILRDSRGEYLMGSQSYSSVETLLLPPQSEDVVAEVILFDQAENETVDYSIARRMPGEIFSLLPVSRTVPVGTDASLPVGFSPPAGGIYKVTVSFEKTRDGDVRVFRGPGEPALTFASARGEEGFLLHIPAGDTVWIDPFYSSFQISGDATVSISVPDAINVEDIHSGTISTEEPVAYLTTEALAGTILDIALAGIDREVDLDLYVTGPGIDLVAEGWISNVDAAGDEAVEVYSEQDATYGITVYLYEREGETEYDLEVDRISRTELADPSPRSEIWALSAGISGYPSAADVLNRASMDAAQFYDFLVENQGVPADHVILLVDALSTADEFIRSMESLLRRAGPEDRVVVFFSGHGDRSFPGSGGPEEEDSANEYICLYDDEISDDTIAAMVDSLANAPVFLFFDACHSGGFVNDFQPGSQVMVLTAAREDLSVSERILTPILLRGSRGDADFNGNGYVSALELMNYIDEKLQLICPECDAELQANTYVCPQCGAVLKGDDAVPRPEQGNFLTEDIELWRVGR